MWQKNKMKTIILILSICIIITIYTITVYICNDEGEKEMQDEIVSTFNDNYSIFLEIASYIENNTIRFYCSKTSERLLVKIDLKEVDIHDLEVSDQLLFMINDLNFVDVLGDFDQINFIKVGGDWEKGILYLKDGVEPNYEAYELGKLVLIKDNWYYYELLLY